VPMPNLHLSASDIDALLASMEEHSAALQSTDRKRSLTAQ
jgi:hypothetical protein